MTDVKIFETSVPASEGNVSEGIPGHIIVRKNRLFVETSDGFIEILSLQPAGKKRMDADAFLRGYKPIRFV